MYSALRSGSSGEFIDKVLAGESTKKREQERFITANESPLRVLGLHDSKERVTIAKVHQQFKVKCAGCDPATRDGQKKLSSLRTAYGLITDPKSEFYSKQTVVMDRQRQRLFFELLTPPAQMMYRAVTFCVYGTLLLLVYLLLKGAMRPAEKLREKRKAM